MRGERDRQRLARRGAGDIGDFQHHARKNRREAGNRAHPTSPEVAARAVSEREEHADKFDYDKGVSGRLIEVGQAPYRNRSDAETSTYVAIELDNGKRQQVWGAGLERATADSGAQPGDRIQVRRDGVERVTKEIKVIDAASGHARIERRQVPRNRWRVTAEEFRTADRQTAARDPNLVAAQSHMVIIEKTLESAFPKDEQARRNILEAVRERITDRLAHGHSFARAIIREPIQDRTQSASNKDDARHTENSERVRIQERGR